MGRLVRTLGLASVFLALGACAGEVEEGAAAGQAASSGPSGGVVGITLKPPVLVSLDSLANVLKLTWETPSACDEVEGERKTGETPFELVFTVPGSDTVFVDAEAIEDQAYTYRLRCKRSFGVSEYSNELTANPADG